jgi:hypothetical protein
VVYLKFFEIYNCIAFGNVNKLYKPKSAGIVIMPMAVGKLVPYLAAIVGRGNRLGELVLQLDLSIGRTAQGIRNVNAVLLSTGAKHGLENHIQAAYCDCNAVTQAEFEFAIAGKEAAHYHPFVTVPGEDGHDGHD